MAKKSPSGSKKNAGGLPDSHRAAIDRDGAAPWVDSLADMAETPSSSGLRLSLVKFLPEAGRLKRGLLILQAVGPDGKYVAFHEVDAPLSEMLASAAIRARQGKLKWRLDEERTDAASEGDDSVPDLSAGW